MEVSGPEPIVKVSVAIPVPIGFTAPRVTEVTAATVGVPEMSPVAVFSVRPVGRPTAE